MPDQFARQLSYLDVLRCRGALHLVFADDPRQRHTAGQCDRILPYDPVFRVVGGYQGTAFDAFAVVQFTQGEHPLVGRIVDPPPPCVPVQAYALIPAFVARIEERAGDVVIHRHAVDEYRVGQNDFLRGLALHAERMLPEPVGDECRAGEEFAAHVPGGFDQDLYPSVVYRHVVLIHGAQ